MDHLRENRHPNRVSFGINTHAFANRYQIKMCVFAYAIDRDSEGSFELARPRNAHRRNNQKETTRYQEGTICMLLPQVISPSLLLTCLLVSFGFFAGLLCYIVLSLEQSIVDSTQRPKSLYSGSEVVDWPDHLPQPEPRLVNNKPSSHQSLCSIPL